MNDPLPPTNVAVHDSDSEDDARRPRTVRKGPSARTNPAYANVAVSSHRTTNTKSNVAPAPSPLPTPTTVAGGSDRLTQSATKTKTKLKAKAKAPKPHSAVAKRKNSARHVLRAAAAIRSRIDHLWSQGGKTPMMQRAQVANSQKPRGRGVRTKRLIRIHAFRVAMAGSAAAVTRDVRQECRRLNEVPPKDTHRDPWQPGITKGAIMLFEQMLCAYAQEAFYHARTITDHCTTGKSPTRQRRVTAGAMTRGFAVAAASIESKSLFGGKAIVAST